MRIRFFCRSALLIVDEIGYLPVVHGGGNLFFQLVNARYEKGAMILTSNRGFAEWGEFWRSRRRHRLLDRLLHHAVVIQIEGSSYGCAACRSRCPSTCAQRLHPTSPIPATLASRRGRPPKKRSRSINPRLITSPANWGILLRHKWGNSARH